MTVTEKQIELVKEWGVLISCYPNADKEMLVLHKQLTDGIIQALQEKAERDKGCGYCNMMLNKKSQLHQVLRGYPANCCINCGRKLGE